MARTCLDCETDISHRIYRFRRCEKCTATHKAERIQLTNKQSYADNKEDAKVRAAASRAANPERAKAVTLAWRQANAERFSEKKRQWREENEDHCAEYRRNQYLKTKDRENELARQWKKDNPIASLGMSMKRAAAKLQAVPAWADQTKIREIYAEARRVSEETGVKHNVDHIMPLQSKFICGLHVETNLRIITKAENHSKKNKFIQELATALIEAVLAKAKDFVASIKEQPQ